MFKIGEFSRFSRVSVKMLRHYDEIGLLKPAHVDRFSGYRYYTADQLPRLNRIVLLKDLEFSLEQIAHLLDESLSTAEIRGVLKLKRSEIQTRMQADARRLTLLQQAMDHLLLDEPLLPHAIILRDVPTQQVASIRQTVTPDGITALFERLEAIVAQHDARAISPPLTIYHDMEYAEDQQDVAVAVPVSKAFAPAQADVRVHELAGAQMACIVYTGGYSSTDPLIRQFPGWLAANTHRAAGPLREVYLRFGANNDGYTLPDAYLTDTSAAFVTELQLPVEPDDTLGEIK